MSTSPRTMNKETPPMGARADTPPPSPASPPPIGGVDITKTPEFQEALSAAVGDALAQALAPIRDQIAAAKPGETVDAGNLEIGSGAEGLLQRLAHLIADVSDQGSGRPARLPPEILAKREAARQRMVEAIADNRARVKRLLDMGRKAEAVASLPRYRAMTKMCLNERLIEPFRMDTSTRQPVPVEFHWDGPPNQAMRPINEAALAIFGHYRDWIGGIDMSEAKSGYISPRGVVILVGDKHRPPVTAMQRNGFQPDFGDLQTEADASPFESTLSLGEADDYGAMGTVDPRAREQRILGTVMSPVIQSQPSDVVRRGV